MQRQVKSPSRLVRLFDRRLQQRQQPRTSHSRSWLLGFLLLLTGATAAAHPGTDTADTRTASPLTQLIAPQPTVQPGQSATQLPDGSWLLLGGEGADHAPAATASILLPQHKHATPLSATLHQPRSGHSATLLPDGAVLILGGTDADGNVLSSAEQFDPATQQFRQLGDLGLIARTGHTATVLADGRLLITGGTDAHGQAIADAELYNPFTRQADHFNARLDTARAHHVAALLPDASVLLFGGLDNRQHPLDNGERYEPVQQRFTRLDRAAAVAAGNSLTPAGIPAIQDSRPAAEAQNAPVDQPLVIRFKQRMAVSTLNPDTVTLLGPQGPVAIQPVAVEYGLLLFITPRQDLLPASRYTLFIKGAKDAAGQPLSFFAMGFNTAQLDGAGNAASTSNNQNDIRNNQNGTSSATGNVAQAVLSARAQQALAAAGKIAQPEDWIPDARHFKGDWRSRRGISPLQKLPPLTAPDGETAVAGQVLKLNGRSLAHVTLSIGDQSVQSDATGRFLLRHLSSGAQVLVIDGASASHGHTRYGVYQVKVDIKDHQTNVLPYTIWNPRLDPAGDITLPSPTEQDTVITTPRIPGLELHIPAGTVIRDRHGKIVTHINMTAIPTDRPPFPIPNVGVPVYFTIQPGGATLTSTRGHTQQGAQLIYPNFSGAAPGSRIDFWNYDAHGKGWYVYGQGTVTRDGKQVVPDPGVAIYEFTGAMTSLPGNAPWLGPIFGGCKSGDPVDCATGLFQHNATDLVVNDILPLEVHRSYRPQDHASRAFGIGTNLSYDLFLVGSTNPWTYQDLILPDGGHIHYVRTSSGTSYIDAAYSHTETPTVYYGSTLSYRGDAKCYWQLLLKDGAQICFPESYQSGNARAAAALSVSDRYGNTLTFTRDSVGNLTHAASPSGRYIDFIYDSNNRITSATDNLGRQATYDYDAAGRLIKATGPDGKFEAYTYDNNDNMLTVQDKRGNMMVTNVYDSNDRVTQQTYADSTTASFAYTLDANGKVTQTDFTDERGIIKRMVFNASGYPTSITHALGLPEQQVTTIDRDPVTNLVNSTTDALGRKTSYTYDASGNRLTVTRLADTPNAVTASVTYSAIFNRLTSVTDFVGHQTSFSYDSHGNLIQTQDANGNHTSASYNGAGQLTQATDALGHSISYTYDGFDLAQVADPLSRSVSLLHDGAGRLRSSTDPLGHRTIIDLDVRDRVTQVTDPLNQSTGSSYDDNSNPTQIEDAQGHTHGTSYDSRNAPASATNALNQSETYGYDAGHNLTSVTDRKGQVTHYSYDALNRLTGITYADSSTVSYTWDAGNRLTRIDDSLNGVITRSYDDLDRLTQETTPKGSVSYTYNANGQRTGMTVSGQPTVSYSYDNGNRLTQISQAAGAVNNNTVQHISFSYDDASRPVQTTYPDGIVRHNSFDAAGELTEIVYDNPDGSLLGNLTYGYDQNGQRISSGGSLARQSLPDSLTGSVNAANRLTTFAGQTLDYDANGNLLHDGVRTYVWNARDQLTEIQDSSNGTVLASYSYDALGRRQTKTVNGIASGYVYDGANIVQELNGSNVDNSNPANVRATYLAGGIDQRFLQEEGSGASAQLRTYLIDALGSTISLRDAAGSKVVDYTYDPYGNTSADATVDNPFQYTGRENDGNGLYYYRARYYSPAMGRFIASDPIGLAGGINEYAYAEGNPISLTDPSGLLSFGQMILTYPPLGVGFVLTALAHNVICAVEDAVSDMLPGAGNASSSSGASPPPEGGEPEGENDNNATKSPGTREELRKDLESKGFKHQSTSEGGYETWTNPDGSKVTIKPDGEVIRTQRVWKSDGSGKYSERQSYEGQRLPDQSHSTGHYVEPFQK